VAVVEPTTAGLDLLYRIKLAVVQKIKNLNLVGGQLNTALGQPGSGTIGDIGQNVYNQLVPEQSNVKFPCVIVTTEGEAEDNAGGSTMTSEWWRPVRVFIADRNTERRQENEPYYLWWRKQIMDAFLYQRLSNIQGVQDIDEVRGCLVNPHVIIDPKLRELLFVVSGMVLKFYTAEYR
jgi:hypothetical protein